MATSSKIELSLAHRGVLKCPGGTTEIAKQTSKLLQENHDRHHIYFNKEGFHNHIVHHLLSLYSLASSPLVIDRQYEINKSYQRPLQGPDEPPLTDLTDPASFKDALGRQERYRDFLVFFQREIDEKGWQAVLNGYLFQRDERAEDMLVRMFMGFFHPLIHLGFGIEFEQPAIIAEALAQAAIHDNWLAPFFSAVEKAAKEKDPSQGKTFVRLLGEIKADSKLKNAAHWEDGNKIRDGILKRAPDEMIDLASQWTVSPNELERKHAEMINAAVYFTAGAQHPPKVIKFDFYFMHCVNCSIFFSTFLAQPWLGEGDKIRLLEWKGRLDLAMYSSRHPQTPLMDEIHNYRPKTPSPAGGDPWGNIFDRAGRCEDDGHAVKLIRALAHGEDVCASYNDREEFPVKDGMWLQIGHMVVDSVEQKDEDRWVRSAGFDEAWKKFPDRPGK